MWWQASVHPTGQGKESREVASPPKPVDQDTATAWKRPEALTKEVKPAAEPQVQRPMTEIGVRVMEPASSPFPRQAKTVDSEPPRAKRQLPSGAMKTVAPEKKDSAPRPEESPSHPTSAEGELFRLALLHQQMGDYKTASELYKKLLVLNPRNAMALNNMGVILKEKGQLSEAVELLRKAIDIDPNYDKAYTNLGVVLQLQDQLKAATESHLRALAINEGNWESAVNLWVSCSGLREI